MEDSEYDEDEEKEDSCEHSENDESDEQCDDDPETIEDKFGGEEDVAKQASKDKGPDDAGL